MFLHPTFTHFSTPKPQFHISAKEYAMLLHPTFTHFSKPKPTFHTPRRQMRCSCIPLLHTFPHQNHNSTPREGRCDVPASHNYTFPRRNMQCSCIPLLHIFPHQNPFSTPREG